MKKLNILTKFILIIAALINFLPQKAYAEVQQIPNETFKNAVSCKEYAEETIEKEDINVPLLYFLVAVTLTIGLGTVLTIALSDKKDRKIIIIAMFIIVLIEIVAYKQYLKIDQSVESQKELENCLEFTGGSYNLIFDTNSGLSIENMKICIACSPDSYQDVPTPQKAGKIFDGWYYDKNFTMPIDTSTTSEIIPKIEEDENGCKTGYKDITLYAKWK